jgi:hypothetical protein
VPCATPLPLIDVPSQSARVQSVERVEFLFTAARRHKREGGRQTAKEDRQESENTDRRVRKIIKRAGKRSVWIDGRFVRNRKAAGQK